MTAHPIDFELQADVFATSELRQIFDEKTRLQRWLRFEAALAEAQGELGIIPAAAAKEIAEQAHVDRLDLGLVRDGYKVTRNSVMPVLKALQAACHDGLGEFVHYGATTQDVVDTGEMLELMDAFGVIRRELLAIETALLVITRRYRDTPMIGRTHGQHAIPITFGLKVTVWLGEVRRHIRRMKSVEERTLYGQLAGAVGTMAAFGDKAEQVRRLTLGKLGLRSSTVAWHTSRDHVADICACLAMASGTMAKIANEVFELGRTELSELREPAAGHTTMSSSTMPHKRNPVLCERVVVLASHVRALLGVVMEGMIHENERDARALWAEWLAVPQIAIYTGTAMNYIHRIIQGLEVDPERMMSNLRLQGELVASEWLLFRLGARIGKMKANEVLHRAIQNTGATGKRLSTVLRADPEIGPMLVDEDMAIIEKPELYIGHATAIVDAVIAEVEAEREKEMQTTADL